MACTDCAPINAKTLASTTTDNSCLGVGDVCNPIADELTPTENERRSYYAGLRIVPYMGEDSTALKMFSRLRNLSPTQSACIQSIKDYALGGEMMVTRRKREGFASLAESKEVSPIEADLFIDFIESFSTGNELMKLNEKTYDNLQENGNAWIQVIFTQTAGVRNVELVGHDQLNVRYKYSRKGEERSAYISQEWSTTYLSQHPPVLIPLYPHVGDMGDGVFTTLIHSANLTTDRHWYGTPPSMASIYFQWLEVMRGDYTQKEYGNGFTGKHFIEFEADHGSSDYPEIAKSFQQVFTRKGDAKTLVLRQRSVNQSPAEVHSFTPNTDEKFQAFVSEDAESQIIKSQNWNGALMGIADPGKLGATAYINDLYRWKFQTVVKPWQNKTLSPLNLAIDLAAQWMGREEMLDYSLGLTNPMAEMLEEMKQAATPQVEIINE